MGSVEQKGQRLHALAQSDVLVVGAGLAGLAAAQDLATLGHQVVIADTSRGISGRAATRRLEVPSLEAGSHATSVLKVDHGAQFFTVRSERLRQLLPALQQRGLVREWTRGFPLLSKRGLTSRAPGNPRYVCPAGMASLGQAFLEPTVVVATDETITGVWPSRHGWSAVSDSGRMFHSRALVINVPAPQALPLVRGHLKPAAIEAIESVVYAPCWAAMIPLDSYPDVPWVGVEIEHPLLAWAALDHTRRPAGAPPVLVLHAAGAWSRAHLEASAETVLAEMLAAARGLLGSWVLRHHTATAHRWRYAQPVIQHPETTIAEGSLVLCGDWCGQGRIEGAIESGWAAASHLKRLLGMPKNPEALTERERVN
jgi:renalase